MRACRMTADGQSRRIRAEIPRVGLKPEHRSSNLIHQHVQAFARHQVVFDQGRNAARRKNRCSDETIVDLFAGAPISAVNEHMQGRAGLHALR